VRVEVTRLRLAKTFCLFLDANRRAADTRFDTRPANVRFALLFPRRVRDRLFSFPRRVRDDGTRETWEESKRFKNSWDRRTFL
jgi:hypothetical protein